MRGEGILCKIVGSGESFAAVRADIRSLLGVGANMSKRPMSAMVKLAEWMEKSKNSNHGVEKF